MSSRPSLIALAQRKSSKAWLCQQSTDPFIKQRAEDGFNSRSAYKLLEISERNGRFLERENVRFIIDLGAASGGWSQIAANARRRERETAPQEEELEEQKKEKAVWKKGKGRGRPKDDDSNPLNIDDLLARDGSESHTHSLKIEKALSSLQFPLSPNRRNDILPKKESPSLLGTRRNINGKALNDEEGLSGKRKPPQTTQVGPAKEGQKGRETAQQGTALRGDIHARSPPKATSPSSNLRMSSRTPGNAASRLPTKPKPSVSTCPLKRPQIQPRESTRVHRTVTRDAAKPGMTFEKAISESSWIPLPSEPTNIASPSPKLRTPRSATITPASTRRANPSSSAARIGRPRPMPNTGTRSGIEGNAASPGMHNNAKTPSKGVQQRRDPTTPTRPTARPINVNGPRAVFLLLPACLEIGMFAGWPGLVKASRRRVEGNGARVGR
ncbi:2' O-ribose methyltransferase [Marasmius crinis-equi]|uniref:2' O-ribose methyltransferase n=1 Tax=Marasmius crinis-equi TaxID=585013 RepID=A0ABR3EZX6_9AGAR